MTFIEYNEIINVIDELRCLIYKFNDTYKYDNFNLLSSYHDLIFQINVFIDELELELNK